MFEISVSGQNVCVLDSEASVVYIQMMLLHENGPNEHVEYTYDKSNIPTWIENEFRVWDGSKRVVERF